MSQHFVDNQTEDNNLSSPQRSFQTNKIPNAHKHKTDIINYRKERRQKKLTVSRHTNSENIQRKNINNNLSKKMNKKSKNGSLQKKKQPLSSIQPNNMHNTDLHDSKEDSQESLPLNNGMEVDNSSVDPLPPKNIRSLRETREFFLSHYKNTLLIKNILTKFYVATSEVVSLLELEPDMGPTVAEHYVKHTKSPNNRQLFIHFSNTLPSKKFLEFVGKFQQFCLNVQSNNLRWLKRIDPVLYDPNYQPTAKIFKFDPSKHFSYVISGFPLNERPDTIQRCIQKSLNVIIPLKNIQIWYKWNPTTRQHHKIPVMKVTCSSLTDSEKMAAAIGTKKLKIGVTVKLHPYRPNNVKRATVCHKCYKTGHDSRSCSLKKKLCKFCGRLHSGKCKLQHDPTKWRCRTCRGTGHHSLHIQCPIIQKLASQDYKIPTVIHRTSHSLVPSRPQQHVSFPSSSSNKRGTYAQMVQSSSSSSNSSSSMVNPSPSFIPDSSLGDDDSTVTGGESLLIKQLRLSKNKLLYQNRQLLQQNKQLQTNQVQLQNQVNSLTTELKSLKTMMMNLQTLLLGPRQSGSGSPTPTTSNTTVSFSPDTHGDLTGLSTGTRTSVPNPSSALTSSPSGNNDPHSGTNTVHSSFTEDNSLSSPCSSNCHHSSTPRPS